MNVVRIGDAISCGDFTAMGSQNVFANGMPISHAGVPATTGHGCFPPTVYAGPFSTTVFVNGNPVTLKGKTTTVPHRCGKKVHSGMAASASPNVSIEA